MPRRATARLAAAALFCVASIGHATSPSAGDGLTVDARYVAEWVISAAEHDRRPFAIVDKRAARVFVFEASGRLVGASAVLLGQTVGDTEPAGLGRRAPSSLAPDERSTPAGRFASVPGHNDKGEAVVWFDHAAGLAIHRLRPAPAQQQRAARMDSPAPGDHRISLGCIVVPVAFYESVVAPHLGRERGVVYVLPETQPVQAMFGAVHVGLSSP